jgi:hypothetical protein
MTRDAAGEWRIREHFIHADGTDPSDPIIPLGVDWGSGRQNGRSAG